MLFDVLLIFVILISVVVVMLESVPDLRVSYGSGLRIAEILFTGLFTVEYVLRLLSARDAGTYARSFYGIVDLVAILPTYLMWLIPGSQSFAVIRILRVLRVFRVLKLAQFVGGERVILRALKASAYKIVVFVIAVLTLVMVVGALMHVIEGPENGFTSIPKSVYWAIVTITTVGFGDVAPQTPLGQMLASVLMILGYGIIAVPTGIVTVEMAQASRQRSLGGATHASPHRICPDCGTQRHDTDADFCKRCGGQLPD